MEKCTDDEINDSSSSSSSNIFLDCVKTEFDTKLYVAHANEEYVCDLCNKVFQNRNALMVHEAHHRTDTVQGPLMSDISVASVKTECSTEEQPVPHEMLEASNNGISPASVGTECDTAEHPVSLESLETTNSDTFPVSVQTECNAEKHSVTNTSEQLPCSMCNKRYKNRKSLLNHQKLHRPDEIQPYRCDICFRGFPEKPIFLEHWLCHYQVLAYACDTCGKRFVTKAELKAHKNVENKTFQCHLCKIIFPCKDRLVVHSRIHTGEKPFVCQICNKRYRDKVSYKYHLNITHGPKKLLHCNKCKKVCQTEKSLKNHLLTHLPSKEYPCLICKKVFSIKESLLCHYRTHTDEKPFSCNVCSKAFNRQHHLVSHLKTHEKD